MVDIAGKAHDEDWQALFQHVSVGYFRVLRIEFKAGRAFSEAEINEGRKAAVVNQAFVRRYSPDENPLGRRVRLTKLDTSAGPAHDLWFEIIGVVADVTNRGLQVPVEPEVWVPYSIIRSGAQFLMVRTSQDPGTMLNTVRKEVWATDSGVAPAYSSTLEDHISERLYDGPRFSSLVMTIFGGIALILVTVGVYSVLAYSTTQKTHEIGIRMALGAEGGDVLGIVVRMGLRLVVAGITIGIAISLVLGRAIGTQLVGVTPYDPLTLAATTSLLTIT